MGKITIELKINTFGKMKHPNGYTNNTLFRKKRFTIKLNALEKCFKICHILILKKTCSSKVLW